MLTLEEEDQMAEISLELLGTQVQRVIDYLRVADTKLDRIVADVGELKKRMSAVEPQVGTINSRLDRMDDRLDHMERRLGLIGEATPP